MIMRNFLLLALGLLLTAGKTNACTTPSALSLVTRTNTTITLSVTPGNPNHQIEYGPLGFTPGSGTLTPWFTGLTRVITGLSGSTGYDFYVRDSCANGQKSAWTSYYGFSTTCVSPATIPWFENFDHQSFGVRTSFNGLGTYMCGWIANPIQGYAWVPGPPFQTFTFSGPASDHSGRSKYMLTDRFGTFSGGGNSAAILRTPQINLAGATQPSISFWYHMFGTQVDSLIVEASQVGSSNWVRLGAIPANPSQFSSQSSPWQQQTYPLTTFLGQTVTVRFIGKGTTNFPTLGRIAIDDLFIGQASGCIPPSNFVNTGVQANTASFSLVLGSSTHHQISIGTPGTAAGSGSIRRFSGTTTTLTGLAANTTYEAYVRDSCGPTSFSSWIGPISLTTACNAFSAPWSENFDNSSWIAPAFNQAGTWPNCWNRSTATGLTMLVGPPLFSAVNTGPSDDHSPGTAGKYVFMDAIGFASSNTSTQFFTPLINLTPLNVPELTFWYHAYGTQIAGAKLHVINSSGVATQVWSSTGQQQSAETDPWQEVIVSLAAYANQTIQLRFTGEATAANAFFCQLAFDDLDVHETPTCPKPTGFTVLSTNSGSVNVSWTGGASPWVVKYGPSGFNPSSAGTRVVASSNPFVLFFFKQKTAYDIYVKDSCGPASVSQWSTMASATTACLAVNAPFTETFNSSQWVVGAWPNLAGSINSCWSRSQGNATTDFYWTVGQGPMQSGTSGPNQGVNGGKYMFTAGFGSNGTGVALLTSPWINTVPLTTPMLRFHSHLLGAIIDELQVLADTGTGWHSVFVVQPGAQASAASPWTLHEVQLPDYSETTVRFRFRGVKDNTTNGWAELAIDEFGVVEAPIPTCTAPSAVAAIGVGVTGATVTFTAGGGSTRIAYGLAGYVPTNATSAANGIASPYPITGLTANTTYNVYLKDSCTNGLASAWVGPLTFTTQPCPAVSANFTSAVIGMNVILTAQNLTPTNTYQWTVTNSSGTVVASPNSGSTTVPIAMQGTYTVRLIVANYCGSSDTVQTTINVCAQLSGGFSFGVTGNTVTFTSAAINAAGAVWNFGDGGQSTATNPVHTYAVSGPYTVTMKAYNICGDTVTASQVVITCSIPTAEWVASVLSSNGAGMRVQFEAGPWCSPDVVGYQWLYGDGTQGFGANPIKTYAVPGLFYNVTLIASNDCGGKDTLTKSLRTVGLDEASVSALWYPNPAASGQWISSPSDGDVAVYTLTGQRLAWPQRVESGRVLVQVPENCPAGVYVMWQGGQAVRLTVH